MEEVEQVITGGTRNWGVVGGDRGREREREKAGGEERGKRESGPVPGTTVCRAVEVSKSSL